MPGYDLYCFDLATGLATKSTLRAEDDAEASRVALERAKDADYELWQDLRLVTAKQSEL